MLNLDYTLHPYLQALLRRFLVMVALLPHDVFSTDRFSILTDCAMGTSHSAQRECLISREAESAIVLRQAENQLLIKLRTTPEEDSFRQSAITAARSDAEEYVIYASKHCDSFASLAFGGNSQGDRRLACRIELNHARTQQLVKVAASVM